MNGWPLDDQAEWDHAESDFHHRLDIHDDADTWREHADRELEIEEELAA